MIRSGIVYSGKILETDGAEGQAVHEADDVRPLAPIHRAASVRIFRTTPGSEEAGPLFFYGNPSSLIGPSQIVNLPDFTANVDFEPYVAAIIATDGFAISVEEAEDYVLGYTLVNFLVARDAERAEKAAGIGPGRSYDLAAAIGPVITTPDEMEETVVDESRGRRFKLTTIARVNGVEVRRGDTEDLPYTLAEIISAASESVPIRAGDVICAGPIVVNDGVHIPLGAEDDIRIAVEMLGTLSMKIG